MTKMGLKGRVKPVTLGRGDMLDRAKLSLDAGRVLDLVRMIAQVRKRSPMDVS